MNAVEIEEAVSELANAPFDPDEFPFAFLTAFGNKETTVKRLRSGSSNASDVAGGVLQRNNIHIAVCTQGRVGETLAALRESAKTAVAKAKFIMGTDGVTLEAEDLNSGETIACDYPELANHFGFLLPLAGISTVRQIKNNPIDIKATGRLNKLYIELLKDNPEWGTDARRHDMNQFMARLIFCFFAEDTGIFLNHLFTVTIQQMSDSQSGNTHEVIAELFRAMDTKIEDRKASGLRPWADVFPYVNGNLFSGTADCPRFTRIARSYLLRAAELNWQEINPDIFGSMIQAVADDEERGELGMHYTSVPNILKVLNPLFLDDLREQLAQAGDNVRKLRNLRKRLSTIRVFDPACGSGNFLVIGYKEMREIEAEIVRRTGGTPKSVIPLTNFYGIEIRDFAAEIARLSLLIAEYQCDVRMIGQREAHLYVLPLKRTGQIHTGNALRLNWLKVCAPTVKIEQKITDLFGAIPEQDEIDFDAGPTETYICGNPPYLGSRVQDKKRKEDLQLLAGKRVKKWKSLDYVAGWYLKAAEYMKVTNSAFAFVSTSSMCEGLQVPVLWPEIINDKNEIFFGHRAFKWSNLASNNAGVSVVIVGVSLRSAKRKKHIVSGNEVVTADNINCYLLRAPDIYVDTRTKPISELSLMVMGAMPRDGGHLILEREEMSVLVARSPKTSKFSRKYFGSEELINGGERLCLWIGDGDVEDARTIPDVAARLSLVAQMRSKSPLSSTQEFSSRPHRFVYVAGVAKSSTIAVAGVSSERRLYLPVALLDADSIASNLLFALYDAPLWTLSLVASRIHLVWIATVCGKLETRYRYSNTLGWNTFPVPPLTAKNKVDLTRCAEDILLAREAHFPETIADLYDPDKMPDNLREAHERNDETLERIYIGRRFRNDTERLEKLFDLYTKMTADKPPRKGAA